MCNLGTNHESHLFQGVCRPRWKSLLSMVCHHFPYEVMAFWVSWRPFLRPAPFKSPCFCFNMVYNGLDDLGFNWLNSLKPKTKKIGQTHCSYSTLDFILFKEVPHVSTRTICERADTDTVSRASPVVMWVKQGRHPSRASRVFQRETSLKPAFRTCFENAPSKRGLRRNFFFNSFHWAYMDFKALHRCETPTHTYIFIQMI